VILTGVYEEWRNKKLQELIDAGINPFIELDLDTLPAEGADASTFFPGRKVYGNVIDGITTAGIKIDSGGLIHYEEDKLHGTYNLDDVYTTIGTQGNWGKWNWLSCNRIGLAPTQQPYNSPSVTPTTMVEFGAFITKATLAAGVLANHVLYQPGAARAYVVYDVYVTAAGTGLAAQNYTLAFQDEDDVEIIKTNWLGNSQGHFRMYQTHASDDKDLECDIADGGAAEDLYFVTIAGKH